MSQSVQTGFSVMPSSSSVVPSSGSGVHHSNKKRCGCCSFVHRIFASIGNSFKQCVKGGVHGAGTGMIAGIGFSTRALYDSSRFPGFCALNNNHSYTCPSFPSTVPPTMQNLVYEYSPISGVYGESNLSSFLVNTAPALIFAIGGAIAGGTIGGVWGFFSRLCARSSTATTASAEIAGSGVVSPASSAPQSTPKVASSSSVTSQAYLLSTTPPALTQTPLLYGAPVFNFSPGSIVIQVPPIQSNFQGISEPSQTKPSTSSRSPLNDEATSAKSTSTSPKEKQPNLASVSSVSSATTTTNMPSTTASPPSHSSGDDSR